MTMTVSNNKRRHIRLKHVAQINLQLPSCAPMIVNMRDFSDSGLYLLGADDKVSLGDIVKVRTLEIEQAPTREAKVVRIVPGDGFAAEFVG